MRQAHKPAAPTKRERERAYRAKTQKKQLAVEIRPPSENKRRLSQVLVEKKCQRMVLLVLSKAAKTLCSLDAAL